LDEALESLEMLGVQPGGLGSLFESPAPSFAQLAESHGKISGRTSPRTLHRRVVENARRAVVVLRPGGLAHVAAVTAALQEVDNSRVATTMMLGLT